MNKLAIYGVAGILVMASVTGNFVQSRTIGKLKAEARNAATALTDCRRLHDDAAAELKERQDANVQNLTAGERRCLADSAAAYDAGRLRDSASVADRQASGAYVPGQRKSGDNR